jgi:hypothetical protein
MKPVLTAFFVLLIASVVNAQSHPPILHPLDRTSSYFGQQAQEQISERGILNVKDVSTEIDGEKVTGAPFLYYEWYPGTVLTTNGRSYEGYKLRYDVYHQVLLFQNGDQSMEVNEPVKEFTLVAPGYDGQFQKFTFIHSDNVKKLSHPVYFELMAGNDYGQLLKLNTKKVAAADINVAIKSDMKAFQLEAEYYYFDRVSKKLSRIKAIGSNIQSILNDTKITTEVLSKYDLSKETGLLQFFRTYLETPKVKTF